MSTVAQTFAAFAARFHAGDPPRAVIEHAKLCILDSLGIALASSRHEFAASVERAARALGGAGSASVIGSLAGLPLRDALLVNGTLIHGLDFDDTHSAAVVHCSASAWPLAFNLGHSVHATGATVLAAYILAVEVDARLGECARGGLQKRGFHPTGVIGAFGCAAAAAWLKGLDQAQFCDALGLVLSLASGNLECLNDGTWSKRMHPGWAAVCGVTAASLAAAGFHGPRESLEGRFGLFNTLLGPDHGIDFANLGADLGRDWRTSGVAFKPYPACHFNHAFADCALALKRAHAIVPATIAHITALIHPDQAAIVCQPLPAKRRPASAYEAQFSLPYMVAATFVRERFTLAELEPTAWSDPAILALAARVDYAADPRSRYPNYYSGGLSVILTDGRRFEHHEAVNRGADLNPLARDDILAKYHANATQVVDRTTAARIAELVLSLDRAPDLDELVGALTGATR